MSYNITSWRVKKLELYMPLAALQYSADFQRRGFRVVHGETQQDGRKTLTDCESTISGYALLDAFSPSEIDVIGEGSGTFYNEVLLPALRQSTGTLEVVIIWEGGDSITRLTAIDGVVTEATVEL